MTWIDLDLYAVEEVAEVGGAGTLSALDIVNMALELIGHNPITSSDFATPTTKAGRVCARKYPVCRDMLLKRVNWPFATGRATGLTAGTDPVFGYTYAFELPSDFLRVQTINTSEDDWVIEGDLLLTNIDDPDLVYTIAEDDPTVFSTEFSWVLVALLASEIAIPITAQISLFEAMTKLYGGRLGEALKTLPRAFKTTDTREDSYISSRRISGSSLPEVIN